MRQQSAAATRPRGRGLLPALALVAALLTVVVGGVVVPTSPVARVAAAGSLDLVITYTGVTSGTRIDAGNTVNYSYKVTNSTGANITDLVVTHSFSGAIAGCSGSLLDGATVTCTTSHSVTQAEVNSAAVAVTVTASSELSVVTTEVTNTIAVSQVGSIALTASSALSDTNSSLRDDAGDTATFTFVATNSGNVDLDDLTITDDRTTWSSVGGECTKVVPGATCTLTRTHVITQADVDGGSLADSASASAGSLAGTATASVTASNITISRVSNATIVKTAGSVDDTNTSGRRDAGDTAHFGIVVTNTGTTTLTSVGISDVAVSASKDCGSLAPAETCSLDVSHVLTQAEVDAGSFSNTAGLDATGHSGAISKSSSASVTIDPLPSLAITTTATSYTDSNSNSRPDVGEAVPITVAVYNDGNLTLTNVTVSSDHSLTTKACASLAPLATCTLTTSYTLTQADIDGGSLTISGAVAETGQSGALDDTDTATAITLARTATASVVTTSDAPSSSSVAVGTSFTFTVTVTNTGNTTLTSVTVSDSLVGSGEGGSSPCTTVLPGATCTLTQPHTVTQSDVDAGEIADTGSVTATSPSGTTFSTGGTPTLTVSIDRTATLGVVTSSSFTDTNSNGRADAGETVTFSVTATNSGNTTLSAVTVSDSLSGGTTGGTTPCATVAPNGTCTFTRTHALTQTEINLGSVDDTGSASATAVTGLTNPTASDLETYTLARTAVFTIATTNAAYVDGNSNSRPDAGETITFTVTATNSGNTTLSAATVSDSLTGGTTGGTSPCTSVAPGGTCTFTRAHPLTQAEINAGSVSDTGSATATPPAGVTLTATPSSATVSLSRSSDMSITKSTTGIVITDLGGYPMAGDKVPYTVTATNTGNTTVTAVTVADELTAASNTCASVAPGGTCVLTTDYYLTQADINAGTRSNKGTVAATSPDGSISKNVTISTSITQHHQLSLANVAGAIVDVNNNGKQDKNDTVTFTLTATNSGNTTLTSVSISSPLTSATHSCGTMAPGATCSFTTTYTLTQADINSGGITNAATVAGTAPLGSAGGVTDSASTTVSITASFSLSLTKTTPGPVDSNSNGRPDAGEVVTYTVTATNNGTTKFTAVTLSDTQTASTKLCGAMDVAEVCTWTFTHTLTQSDIDSGSLSGTATASGSGRGGGSATTTASKTVTIDRTASLSLDTTSGGITEFVGAGRHDAGDKVTFTVTVTNTGNTTLTSLTVSDSIGSGSTVCATLAPGATCVLSTTHTITQSEVDAGSVSDTGSVLATPQSGLTLSTSGTATATQSITRTATASVVTTAATFVDTDSDGFADAGETIAFTVTVTNSGNTTLTSMTVSDTLTDGTPGGTSPCATVAPGGTCTRTRTHTLTQAEVDAGSVANTGSVTATPQSGLTLTADGTPTRTVTIVRSSTVSFVNTAGSLTDAALPTGASPGDTIGYTIVATNTGTTTLTGVTVSDGVTAGTHTCATLAPAATCTLSTTYTLVQSDVDAGKVDNTASLAYTGHAGAGSTTSKATTNVPQTNTLSFTNTAGSVIDDNSSGRTDVGDSITYTLAMQNTGNTTLTSVSMYSPRNTYTKSCGTIAPGATCSATTKYTLVQSDLNAGSVSNAGTISATSPGGALSGSDTATTSLPRSSTVTLSKTAGSLVDANTNSKDDAGDTITYTVTATNTGTTTLTNMSVADPLTGDSTTCASVAPSGTCTLTAIYTLLQSDLDLGSVANTATVTATGHLGQVSATADRSVSITRVGAVSLAMTTGAVTDTVTFTLTARNTGNTTLRSVVVTDTLTSGVKRCATLAPNATCVLSATYTLGVADIDAGSVANSGDVAASAFDGARSATATATATMPTASSISVAATAATPSDDNHTGRVDAGDSVTFTVVATNDGNSSLSAITVHSTLTAASSTCTRLAPGEDCTLVTTHVLTQAEVDAGTLVHGSTATATAPDGSVSDTDSLSTAIARASSVSVATTATSISDTNSSGRNDAGDRVTFTVTARNSGTTTLASMSVSDTLTDGSPTGTSPCSSVAPGATCTRVRVHTLTQTEVDAGGVTNTGSASATGHAGLVTGSGAKTVSITRTSSLSVITTASALIDGDANGDDVGDTLTFTVTVTNTGNTTLTSLTVTDSLTGGSTGGTSPCASVTPGATCTRTRTHTLTQPEVNAGSVTDTGSASATGHSGLITGSGAKTVTLTRTSRLAVATVGASIIDANISGRNDAGDTVAFTVTATNTGNTTLTSVTVSLVSATNTCATLAPGADCVLHSTRTLEQSEVDAGLSTADGSASGTGHAGSVTASGSTTVAITRASSIAVDQVAGSVTQHNSTVRTDVGDTILYTVTATNTGSTTLTTVVVSDDLTEATETCASLAPGASCILTTGHTLVQADLDRGAVDNSASASAIGHLSTVSDSDTTTVSVSQESSLSISNHAGAVVDANGTLRVDAGDTVTFGVLVTNTGTVTIKNAVITDPLTSATVACADLVPGARCSMVTQYELQLDDVNDGSFINTVSVSGIGHAGSLSTSASRTVTLVQTAQVTASSSFVQLVDTDNDGVADAGEFARFSLRALNSGSTTLRSVQVTDPDHPALDPATITCPLVAPGDYCELISDVELTQYDIDTNQVGATAVVTAKPTNGADVGDETSSITTLVTSELLSVAITETGRGDVNANGVLDVGDSFSISVVATNVGSRTLRNVVVTDGHVAHTRPCSLLAPGATCTLVATHTITVDDVALGFVESSGSAEGLGPVFGSSPVTASDTTISLLDPAGPSLQVSIAVTDHTDSDGSTSITVGDVLEYTISARNLASTTAHGVVLTSELTGETHTCATVVSKATCSFTTTHTVTEAEAAAGTLVSTAQAVMTDGVAQFASVTSVVDGGERLTVSASLTSIDLSVAGPTGRLDAGDVGHWSYVITNRGDVTLTALALSGPIIGDLDCPSGALLSLAAEAQITCTLDRAITQADIDAEQIDVSLTATSASGTTGSAALVSTLAAVASIDLSLTVRGHGAECDDASALPIVGVGGTARWCYAITNTGNRTLESLTIVGLEPQPDTLPSSLAPGATVVVSLTSTHEVSVTLSATVGAVVSGSRGLGGTNVESASSSATLTVSLVQPVSGIVWFDLDLDGSPDEGEPLLHEVAVTLAAAGDPGTVIATAVTDDEGTYSFDEVLPGSYLLAAEQGVRGVTANSDPDGGSDWSTAIEVADAPVSADFGGTGMASMSGRVLNATTEQPIPGVTVTCWWLAFDGVSFTATTGGDGRYTLARLPYGDERCVFTAPGFSDPEEFTVMLEAPTTPFGDMYFGRQTPLVGNDPRPLLALALLLTMAGAVLVVATRRNAPRYIFK